MFGALQGRDNDLGPVPGGVSVAAVDELAGVTKKVAARRLVGRSREDGGSKGDGAVIVLPGNKG